MMRLLRVELIRLFSRRAVVVIMLLGALTLGGVTAGLLYENRPVSATEIASAQEQLDRDSRYTQRSLDRCVERSANAGRCKNRYGYQPSLNDYLYRSQLSPREYKDWLIPMAGISAVLAVLIGATFIGADYASGSLGTQLLFEPSRSKVWAAKAVAVVLGAGAFGLISLGLANAAIYLMAKAWDRPMPEGLLGDYSTAIGRGALFTAAAGLLGYALVLISRHTVAALGIVALYLVAAETVLRMVSQGSEKWLLSNHVLALVGGSFKRKLYPTSCFDRASCRPEVLHFTLPFAISYLGAGLLAIAIGAWILFQRRDVA